MKLLTKQTDYAVRALLHLARVRDADNPFVSSRTLAEAERIPLQFLRGILRALAGAGLVESREGVNGGVALAAAPGDIRLADVICLFQGDIQLTECLFRKQLCHNRANCVLRHKIMEIEQKVAREFEGITIGSLLSELNETTNETNDHPYRRGEVHGLRPVRA